VLEKLLIVSPRRAGGALLLHAEGVCQSSWFLAQSRFVLGKEARKLRPEARDQVLSPVSS
jgi:hypothetical protein